MNVAGTAAAVRTFPSDDRSSAPDRLAAAVAAAGSLTGTAALGMHLLHGTETADAHNGTSELGTTAPRTTSTPTGTSPASSYLALEATAPRAPTSANDPAAFNAMLRTDGAGWAAADGTKSIPLPDGKVLWLFDDTLVNLPNSDGSLRRNADFVRNSAILQDGDKVTTIINGTDRGAADFAKPAAEDEWYWPGHGIVQGDELVLFMRRMHTTTTGELGWNYESVGTDMLRLDLADLSVKERVHLPASSHTDWGTAVVNHGGHTLVYGYRDTGGLDRTAVLARTTAGELGTAPMEYWNGKRWSKDEADAAPIADGVSTSFSVIPTPDGRFAMVSQELFFGTKLQARTADRPQGPWSEWRTIDKGPKKADGTISYNAQAHPTFTTDGKLLVSWNMNRADASIPDPDELETYRPVFRAIDMKRITGSTHSRPPRAAD